METHSGAALDALHPVHLRTVPEPWVTPSDRVDPDLGAPDLGGPRDLSAYAPPDPTRSQLRGALRDESTYWLVQRWRRFVAGPYCTHYQRLAALILIGNVVIGWQAIAARPPGPQRLSTVSLLVAVNLAAAALIRQQHVVNVLFAVATRVPRSWPLAFRRLAGKVYHFGGIHVGTALAAVGWWLCYVVLLWRSPQASRLSLVLSVLTGLLLLRMVVQALPNVRQRFHDRFEQTHRFGGWTVLVLMAVQVLLDVRTTMASQGWAAAVVQDVRVWLLGVVVASVALPWLRLRKVPVTIETPSNHVAILSFDYGVTPFPGSSTALATHPLGDYHSFANIPHPDSSGFRLAVSRAGDWTGSVIAKKPTHLWTKGITTAGVGNIDQIFGKVLWVATGSGIGPCLPHLFARTAPAALLWSTRTPEVTYGRALLDEIIDSVDELVLWDTVRQGKPDLVDLTCRAVAAFEVEAVICISNKPTTWQIVQSLEVRGVPAFGAIWDS